MSAPPLSPATGSASATARAGRCATARSRSRPARSPRSSARTAPARRRCCSSRSGLTGRAPARSRVFGRSPRRDAASVLPARRIRRAGPPALPRLHVAETLKLGPQAQPALGRRARARRASQALGLPLGQKVGKLSGGQQAQVALTLALAKRPGAAGARRAGRVARPARPPRVHAVADGGRRRDGHDGRPLLPHRRRPRARLRSPRDPLRRPRRSSPARSTRSSQPPRC